MDKKVGKIIIFVGPSGVGKATIEKELFKDKNLNIAFSISATTRPPRHNETHGNEYYFLTNNKFKELIKNDELLEWSHHFNYYYGTLNKEIERITSMGKHAFLEIETNGAIQIFKKLPKDKLITIFIMPPLLQDLESRIRNRNTETEDEIEIRLNKARTEVEFSKKFDYIIINASIQNTVNQIKEIIMENS